MTDILERLKASSKINGAYPRNIEDAIAEIERLRWILETWKQADEENRDANQL